MNYFKVIQRSNIKLNVGAFIIFAGLIGFISGAITLFFNPAVGLSILAGGLLSVYLGTAVVQDAEAALRVLMNEPEHLL